MRTNRLLAVVTGASLLAGAAVAGSVAGPAQAATHDYPVMNTSEYPPDGIYFRSGPDWNTAVRVTGYGVFAGERVHLQCFTRGATNVPRRDGGSNNVWYVANNLSRAKASTQDSRDNVGWINAHFVNDGTGANEVANGVPGCVNGAPPTPAQPQPVPPQPPPAPRPVFYSGVGDAYPTNALNPVVRKVAEWSIGDCDFTAAAAGAPVDATTLTGFSKGRLGPIYYLRHGGPTAMRQINYVLMIDPGSYGDMTGSCDNPAYKLNKSKIQAGKVLADWLGQNDKARLVILAGKYTGEKGHKGIQEYYFNAIRSAQKKDSIERSSQVLICNYGGGPRSHDDHHKAMFNGANYYVGRPRITSCPRLDGVAKIEPTSGWNPGT